MRSSYALMGFSLLTKGVLVPYMRFPALRHAYVADGAARRTGLQARHCILKPRLLWPHDCFDGGCVWLRLAIRSANALDSFRCAPMQHAPPLARRMLSRKSRLSSQAHGCRTA